MQPYAPTTTIVDFSLLMQLVAKQVTSPTGASLEEYEIDSKPFYTLGRTPNDTDIVLVRSMYLSASMHMQALILKSQLM